MSKKYKMILRLFLLACVVLTFTACKIIEDNKDIFDTKDPVEDGMTDHGHGHHHDDGMVEMPPDYQPMPTELSYIKLNGSPIDVKLNMSGDLFNARKNNSVAKADGSNIETIEFGFVPNKTTQEFKNYISVNLRSLDGGKSLSVNYDAYPMGMSDGQMQFEENISAFYDDYRASYYTSSYEMKSDSTGHYFNISAEKLSINVVELLTYLQENHFNDHSHDHNMPLQTVEGSYDITSKFFADELFSLQINMGGELIYDGQVFWALNNCVFASTEPSPSDVGDICKAYLAMY